jgi:hypothetical protein
MAIEYDKSGKLFQIDYQSPFGGIDSTAYASAINPANFVSMINMFVQDNVIQPIALELLGGLSVTGHYMGFIPVQSYTSNSASIGFIVTDTGVWPVVLVGNTLGLGPMTGYTPTLPGDNSYFHYIVIDSIQSGAPTIYWTSNGWNEIWTRDPTSGNITLNTNFVGGGILALLDDQLLNLGGFSQADGPTPNRISWSAPGQFGVFQPFDLATMTGNYAAGFNDLPSISDIITGFAAIGTVGYLFRNEGITQINPTGNGILPFQFNHLWASELGIGCAYTNTISQYGSVICFAADSGIYTLGLNGLNEIGQQARSFIYSLLNNVGIVNAQGMFAYGPQGRVLPYILTSPELYYLLAIPVSGQPWQNILIDVATGTTYNLGQQVPVTENTLDCQLAFLATGATKNPPVGGRIIVPLAIFSETGPGSITPEPTFYRYFNNDTVVGTLVLRKEQLKFGYVPTITKVGFLASLIDSTVAGSIQVSIDGGLTFGVFPTIDIAPGVGNPGNGIIDNVFSDAVVSLQRPQLAIKLTNVQVVECWYQGTLADFPLI